MRRFFGASNSSDGFKNYFGECFERADRLFIIKGGPGTGKSSFMRRVAQLAEREGYYTEHYFCSSDHTSYDGVLFLRGGEYIGLVDGTFPHPYIEKLPGLREEILNTGEFWDREILCKNRADIRHLCAKKSKSYDNAYSYLRGCGNLYRVESSYTSQFVDAERIKREADRLMDDMSDGITHGITHGAGFYSLPTPVNCVGMRGRAHLDTFEQMAEKIYILSGEAGAHQLLCELFERSREKNIPVNVAPDPIHHARLDGIYFHGIGAWVVRDSAVGGQATVSGRYPNKCRVINMRELEVSGAGDIREQISYCRRLSDECLEGALTALAEAGQYHFALEEIYKSAMDFSGLDGFVNKFCEKIFG